MILLAHALMPEPSLEKTARRRSADVLPDKRIKTVAGNGFLREQNLAACAFLNTVQNFKVANQLVLVNDVAWRFYLRIFRKNFL
jgi:hypothetical protein